MSAASYAPSCAPADVVIMDNLSPHKSATDLLDRRGWCPGPVSAGLLPDLNPIEKMWSKIKACLRTAEARTQAVLIEAIAAALQKVSRQDAFNWFACCGYSFLNRSKGSIQAKISPTGLHSPTRFFFG